MLEDEAPKEEQSEEKNTLPIVPKKSAQNGKRG